MPFKINVSLSKKTGLPDYGCVGAMCGVEFQLDSSMPQDDEPTAGAGASDSTSRMLATTSPTSWPLSVRLGFGWGGGVAFGRQRGGLRC